ncbi:MAG: toxin TcdB middle/N-terminal domain-containing protein [Bradymonadia bacterium]
MRLRLYAATPLLLGLSLASPALAQHGAGDDRVSLPEGPGSLEGIGDNAAISGNMGSMSYAVPIEVPAGFPAVTPDLALVYDSAGPAGVMGIGWDMPVPFVERMTNWRLPDYDIDDDFVAGGQLVHIGDGVYRNRFEKGFSRHTWHERGDGTQGYWTTELPDGTVQYFGATAEGTPVDSARAAGRDGATFRYHLVSQVDKFGHRMDFSYRLFDGLPHLDRIEYIFTGTDGGPGASLTFEYENRPDVLSDARSGSNERRTQRLTHVNVFSKEVRVWRYTVRYEDEALSNGLSRVSGIDRVGLDNTPHPIAFDFEYSKTLGNDNCDDDCDQPYLVDMGSIGVNLAAGDATLADMNGDGLPDIIDTSRQDAHRIFVNRFADRAQHIFDAPYDSAVGDRAGHQLSSPYVQTLDANGDGRVDMVNVRTGEVLYNLGDGDWAEASELGSTAALPDFGDDFGGGADEPAHVRFFDYDNDRRIDVLRSSLNQTQIYANMGEAGFEVVDDINAIGAGFDGGLDLADMNGDGLLDPVILRAGSLSYRLNLGFGRWSAWTDIENLPFNEAELEFVELQDINGDSLDDLVIVVGDELRFALNRAGTHFDTEQTINAVDGQRLPTRVDGTTVLFADMNGSGSDDVVWITPQGDVTYLELFPVRPNLLTKLTNGLGLVTEVSYTTMVEERAASEEDWAFTLPFSMNMAKTIDTYDSLNAVHLETTFHYTDAYYDTQEKAYRGFAHVVSERPGDETQDAGRQLRTFDVGAEDRYRNGLVLSTVDYSLAGEAPVALRTVTNHYEDCAVDGVESEDLSWPVRHVCLTEVDTLVQEGAAESQWAHLRQTYAYDGDGNLTLSVNHGVVDIGGDACAPCDRAADSYGAPCGQGCEGDETVVQTDYTRASQGWQLGLPVRVRTAAEIDSPEAATTEYFYDGDDFVGLPSGEATLGLLTRERVQVTDDTWVDTNRSAYDDHGNVVRSLDALGDPQSTVGELRSTYDDEHLLLASTTHDMGDYQLRAEFEYHPVWGLLSVATAPYVIRDGEALTPQNQTRIEYDDLGEVIARFYPGDPDGRPTLSFELQWGAPVSRLVSQMRTTSGASAPDVISVLCRDGYGRNVAQVTEVDGAYEVSGYSVLNQNGAAVEVYRGHVAETDNCLLDAPDLSATMYQYDALGRARWIQQDDAAVFGTASQSQIDVEPLARHTHAPDDLDPDMPGAGTPITHHYDGLGRVVRIEMRETPESAPLEYRYEYDVRGGLKRVVDAEGGERLFVRDRAGQVIEATSPDRGLATRTYDGLGNVLREEDGAGRVLLSDYDAVGRLIARWDEADPEGTRVEYAYDLPTHCPEGVCPNGAGQRVQTTFPTPEGRGTRWLTHDDRRRLTGTRLEVDGVQLQTTLAYDNIDRLLSVTYPDGTVERRTYDAAGRVLEIEGVATLDWQRNTLLRSMAFENGVTTTHAYDVVERPARLQIAGATGELLDLQYAHDRLGNLSAIDDRTVVDDQPGRSTRYTFDGLNRLVSAHLDPGRSNFEELLTYSYDRRQNLVEKMSSRGAASRSHVGALAYEADRPYALAQAGDLAYDHDEAGRLTQRGALGLSWDAFGQLASAERDGARVERHWHDGYDRVVSHFSDRHVIAFGGDFTIEDGISMQDVRLGALRLATRESDALMTDVLGDLAPLAEGNPAADGAFTTGDAVIAARIEAGELETDTPHAAVRSMLRGLARSRLLDGDDRWTFAHHDATRQLVFETDTEGAIIDRFAPDPHGLQRDIAGAERGFEGRKHDHGTDLVTIGARSLDPWAGQWTAPDPQFAFANSPLEVGSPFEATNPFGFVLNNPLRYTDPSGLAGEAANDLDRKIVLQNGLMLGDLARGDLNDASVQMFLAQPDINDILDTVEAYVKDGAGDLAALQDLADLAAHGQGDPDMIRVLLGQGNSAYYTQLYNNMSTLKTDIMNVTPTLQANLRLLRDAKRRAAFKAKRARHDAGTGIVLNDRLFQDKGQANAKLAGKGGNMPASGSWGAQQQSQKDKSKKKGQRPKQKSGAQPSTPKTAPKTKETSI